MANKILISKRDVGDAYEPSDSEEEYSAREKKLLQKVRTGRKRNVNPEQELLAFAQNDDDENDAYHEEDEESDGKFEAESDMEDGDAEDGIPDARAWGKKRTDFYSTDFVDQDYSSYNTREEEMAEQEETEARAIQQRLAKQLEESDFTLDVFGVQPSSTKKDRKGKGDETILKKDLSSLSQRQKEQLFKKESPEFEGLVDDFKKRMNEKIEVIDPALKYFSENSLPHPVVLFLRNLNQLILNYCTNVSFYLVLKAKRVQIKNHPVVKRLVKIRQLLNQLDTKYNSLVRPQLEELLKNVEEGVEFAIASTGESKKPAAGKKKLRFLQAMESAPEVAMDEESEGDEGEAEDDDMDFEKKLKLAMADSDAEEQSQQGDEEGEDAEERRHITYQIAKNKGLTPYRKKELRNPRVKHRNKFRKALIRRKGAVRTVRKEIKRYDGEKFGIKASVKKGIKIK